MAIGSVITKIGNYARGLKNRKLEVASKAFGIVTAGSIIYDTHCNGKSKAISTDRIETADRYESNYKHYMTLDKKSPTIANLKGTWFDMQRSFSWYHVISKLTGYFYGASKTILSNIPEIALSVLALKTKKHPFLGKTAGVLLGINTGKIILHDTMGIVGSKD